MAINWGYIQSDGPDYTDVSNGVSTNLQAFSGGFEVGQQSTPADNISWIQFLEFDTSNLPASSDELYLCVLAPAIFPAPDNAFTLKIALYDYGNTFDETLWMTPAELAALSPIVATVPAAAFAQYWMVPLDLGLITLGGTVRFVLFLDEQATSTPPTFTSPDFIGIGRVDSNSGLPRLIARTFNVDPGSTDDWETEILSDTPDLFWRLNETSGTIAADSSGNGEQGTYVNAPTLGVASLVAGDFAIHTSSADDSHVKSVTDFADTDYSSNGLTMEVVLNAEDFTGALYFPPVGFEGDIVEIDIESWGVDDLSGRSFVGWGIAPNDNEFLVGFAFVESDVTQHLVAAIAPGGEYRDSVFYVNGDAYVACSAPNDQPTTGHLHLSNAAPVYFYAAGDQFVGDSMDGVLDEAVLYGHQLSGTRVRVHYASMGVTAGPQPPSISSLDPTSGDIAGGETLAIVGLHFDTVTDVQIDGVSISFTIVTAYLITVTTPAHAAGSVIVTVTNDQGSDTISFLYVVPSAVPPQFIPGTSAPGSGEIYEVSRIQMPTLEAPSVVARSRPERLSAPMWRTVLSWDFKTNSTTVLGTAVHPNFGVYTNTNYFIYEDAVQAFNLCKYDGVTQTVSIVDTKTYTPSGGRVIYDVAVVLSGTVMTVTAGFGGFASPAIVTFTRSGDTLTITEHPTGEPVSTVYQNCWRYDDTHVACPNALEPTYLTENVDVYDLSGTRVGRTLINKSTATVASFGFSPWGDAKGVTLFDRTVGSIQVIEWSSPSSTATVTTFPSPLNGGNPANHDTPIGDCYTLAFGPAIDQDHIVIFFGGLPGDPGVFATAPFIAVMDSTITRGLEEHTTFGSEVIDFTEGFSYSPGFPQVSVVTSFVSTYIWEVSSSPPVGPYRVPSPANPDDGGSTSYNLVRWFPSTGGKGEFVKFYKERFSPFAWRIATVKTTTTLVSADFVGQERNSSIYGSMASAGSYSHVNYATPVDGIVIGTNTAMQFQDTRSVPEGPFVNFFPVVTAGCLVNRWSIVAWIKDTDIGSLEIVSYGYMNFTVTRQSVTTATMTAGHQYGLNFVDWEERTTSPGAMTDGEHMVGCQLAPDGTLEFFLDGSPFGSVAPFVHMGITEEVETVFGFGSRPVHGGFYGVPTIGDEMSIFSFPIGATNFANLYSLRNDWNAYVTATMDLQPNAFFHLDGLGDFPGTSHNVVKSTNLDSLKLRTLKMSHISVGSRESDPGAYHLP